jgi:hypothetical protein
MVTREFTDIRIIYVAQSPKQRIENNPKYSRKHKKASRGKGAQLFNGIPSMNTSMTNTVNFSGPWGLRLMV